MKQKIITFILVILLAACSAPAPVPSSSTPLPPSPMPAPSPTPTQADLEKRMYDALGALNTFGFTVDTTTQTQQRLEVNGKTQYDVNTLEIVHDGGRRVMVAGHPSIVLRHWTEYPNNDRTPIEAELRLVDGVLYINGAYLKQVDGLPKLPQRWFILQDQTGLVYWPTLQQIALDEVVSGLKSEAISLFTNSTLEQFRSDIHQALVSATHGSSTRDGAPVEVITFTLQTSAYRQTVRSVDLSNPVNVALFESQQGTPITQRFTLDAAGHLLEWERHTVVDVQNMDISSAPGAQPGSRLFLTGVQTVLAHINQALESAPLQAVAAPTAVEMEPSPVFSGNTNPLAPFRTLDEFDASLNEAVSSGNADLFWQQIKSVGQMPLIFGSYAVFLYRGPATNVAWNGDWSSSIPAGQTHLGNSDVWIYTVQLPTDARVEYQLRLDGGQVITDSLNPTVEVGGLGVRSVVIMPDYVFPEFTRPRAGIAQGELTDNLTITSTNLGYAVHYRVYTPAGYETLARLPTLYVTDGQDYLNFGRITTVLDNLIADGKIRPIIAVLIDPRDIVTDKNLREEQFLNNPRYGTFIAGELVPVIDAVYRTDPSPDARALLGASYGGYHGAYFALRHSNQFHLIAMQSPTFGYDPTILDEFRNADRLPVKIFMSVGLFNDTTYHTRLMRDTLQQKGYELSYIESDEGHSYGNWRGKLDKMLSYFFPQ